jgi:hypothetical protein
MAPFKKCLAEALLVYELGQLIHHPTLEQTTLSVHICSHQLNCGWENIWRNVGPYWLNNVSSTLFQNYDVMGTSPTAWPEYIHNKTLQRYFWWIIVKNTLITCSIQPNSEPNNFWNQFIITHTIFHFGTNTVEPPLVDTSAWRTPLYQRHQTSVPKWSFPFNLTCYQDTGTFQIQGEHSQSSGCP